jgi:tetratricopeptide (TPR) repeat protein
MALVNRPSRDVQAARWLWNQGRRAEALLRFEAAITQEPDNVRTYVMAARAQAEQFDFERMEEIHQRLVRRAPEHPGVHHCLGETYGLLKLPERAMASYRRAAALPGGGPPTWMELASLCERAHRLDEAEELIERTVRSGFELPMVAIVRGRIQRRLKRPDAAEATLLDLVGRTAPHSDWVAQAWGELALIRDAQGDFGGAIDAIERCKRAQRPRERVQLAASHRLETFLRAMLAAITREHFERWRESARPGEPRRTALLTGSPRSGTTLLEQALDAHPDLVSSEERDFIGRELLYAATAERAGTPLLEALDSLRPDEIAAARARYFRGMEYLAGEPIGGRLHLDKNPSHNLTIPQMLRFFPDTRLIIALRDPRDVVLSCYLRYLPLNPVSVHFLDVRRTAERYAFDMGAWLQLREQVGVPFCQVRYEDFVADPTGQTRRALDSLGLAPDSLEPASRRKWVTSPSYEAVARPPYTHAIGRWKSYAPLLEPAMAVLDPFVRAFGYD